MLEEAKTCIFLSIILVLSVIALCVSMKKVWYPGILFATLLTIGPAGFLINAYASTTYGESLAAQGIATVALTGLLAACAVGMGLGALLNLGFLTGAFSSLVAVLLASLNRVRQQKPPSDL